MSFHTNVSILNREMTDVEFERMKQGFNENSIEKGVEAQAADRIGFVAEVDDEFIGGSSGLAYKNGDLYSGWFYLTDLFVEKEYRLNRVGQQLLSSLEAIIKSKEIYNIWTWTAGYEAPEFYVKQGYHSFAEMKQWYSDGSSRIGLKKRLR